MLDENPLATKTDSFIKTLTPNYDPAGSLKAFFELGKEVYQSALAARQAKGKADAGSEDVVAFTQAHFAKVFADLGDDELKNLAKAFSNPEFKNLLAGFNAEGSSLCSHGGVLSGLTGMQIAAISYRLSEDGYIKEAGVFRRKLVITEKGRRYINNCPVKAAAAKDAASTQA